MRLEEFVFAVDHSATALLIKRRFPSVSITPFLVFFAGIPGPEQLLAGHPMLIVTLIFGQVVAMLVLVGLFSTPGPALRNVSAQAAVQQAVLRSSLRNAGERRLVEAAGFAPTVSAQSAENRAKAEDLKRLNRRKSRGEVQNRYSAGVPGLYELELTCGATLRSGGQSADAIVRPTRSAA